ncbi:hypothetical protein RCL_jg24057.t1 [Rhizophagus clarus]|uniref:Uncharacterized protein n=1 Tax=Rhizophagus clarus TaxID=94130 RepID=A0A8H3LM36_9GLOM|nr:hypothetical protein RCL_jg24057.t1 [Rhizophagus clarus]
MLLHSILPPHNVPVSTDRMKVVWLGHLLSVLNLTVFRIETLIWGVRNRLKYPTKFNLGYFNVTRYILYSTRIKLLLDFSKSTNLV